MTIRLFTKSLLAFALVSVTLVAEDGKPAPKFDPEKIFTKLDANGDKKISKEEMSALAEKLPKGGDKAGVVFDRLFQKLDADSDGFLTVDEFKKLSELREKIDPSKFEKLKKALDAKRGESPKTDIEKKDKE